MSPKHHNPQDWGESHAHYWNIHAAGYDHLYKSRWSELENKDITHRLSVLMYRSPCRILDLGSGTGLGYELSRQLTNANYIGIDISQEMISVAKQKWPDAIFLQQPMNDLTIFADNSFDFVISLFCAFSYEINTRQTVNEIHRVLKKDGIAFICALNRWSLRRVMRLAFGAIEVHTTRGGDNKSSIPAHVFSVNVLRSLFSEKGFLDVRVGGQGVFSGVVEHPSLWSLDNRLANSIPAIAHMLIITARK